MRLPFLFAVSSFGAVAAEPTLLAEIGAFLLGNAHRCGVASERVVRAGKIIRDMIASAAHDASEAQLADQRFMNVFISSAHPVSNMSAVAPPCIPVVKQFERLERYHQQAGYTD